jgi:hypothetical protein
MNPDILNLIQTLVAAPDFASAQKALIAQAIQQLEAEHFRMATLVATAASDPDLVTEHVQAQQALVEAEIADLQARLQAM